MLLSPSSNEENVIIIPWYLQIHAPNISEATFVTNLFVNVTLGLWKFSVRVIRVFEQLTTSKNFIPVPFVFKFDLCKSIPIVSKLTNC